MRPRQTSKSKYKRSIIPPSAPPTATTTYRPPPPSIASQLMKPNQIGPSTPSPKPTTPTTTTPTPTPRAASCASAKPTRPCPTSTSAPNTTATSCACTITVTVSSNKIGPRAVITAAVVHRRLARRAAVPPRASRGAEARSVVPRPVSTERAGGGPTRRSGAPRTRARRERGRGRGHNIRLLAAAVNLQKEATAAVDIHRTTRAEWAPGRSPLDAGPRATKCPISTGQRKPRIRARRSASRSSLRSGSGPMALPQCHLMVT